jgi:hypothetical protein
MTVLFPNDIMNYPLRWMLDFTWSPDAHANPMADV